MYFGPGPSGRPPCPALRKEAPLNPLEALSVSRVLAELEETPPCGQEKGEGGKMAKSLRSKMQRRLRTLRRDLAQPFYDKKEESKLAAQQAALAAPKVPVRAPKKSEEEGVEMGSEAAVDSPAAASTNAIGKLVSVCPQSRPVVMERVVSLSFFFLAVISGPFDYSKRIYGFRIFLPLHLADAWAFTVQLHEGIVNKVSQLIISPMKFFWNMVWLNCTWLAINSRVSQPS